MKGKRLLIFFLIVAMLLGIVQAPAAAEELQRKNRPVITGYSSGMSSIQKGDQVTLVVSVKDTDLTKGGCGPIDITKLVDSFSDGSVSVEITSDYGAPLTYDITFSNMTYSGSGKTLRFMIGYRLWPEFAYETMELTVTEAVEYVEKEETPEAIPEPMVLISRSEIEEPLEPGQEIDVAVTFQNLSGVMLSSPVAAFSVSDSLMLVGDASSQRLDDIPAKSSQEVSVRVKALDTVSSPTQTLNVELKYNYNNNVTTTQGQASDKVSIPVEMKTVEKNSQPTLIITRSALEPVTAKQKFEMSLFIKNAGTVSVENVVLNVSTADTLLLRNKRSTFVIDSIEPGESEEIVLKLKAAKELSTASQTVSLDLKYSYSSGEEVVQAAVTETLALSSVPTEPKNTEQEEKMDSAVPNVIIRTFDYGTETISAGSSFPLNIVFVNTGKLAIENIVATVDGGESFTIAGGTNTFYYDRLGAGAEAQQLIQMQALATAKTGAQAMSISFKYEYVDGKKRASSSADIKLSIPVLQPERFQVDPPVPPETAYAWEETMLSINYVNKGKSEINNVEATIEGNVQALTPTQYLGNFESGKSGTINFIFTPTEVGETELTLKISYEDANQQVHTLDFPVKLTVSEAYVPEYSEDYPMEEMPEENKDHKWIFIVGGAVLLIVLLIVIRVIRKKRAKKKQEAAWSEWDASWDDERTDGVKADDEKTDSVKADDEKTDDEKANDGKADDAKTEEEP